MTPLPDDARRRLVAPLREVLAEPPLVFREHHSLPTCSAWHAHSLGLRKACQAFDEAAASVSDGLNDYTTTREAVARVLAARFSVWSALLTLQPFTFFDPEVATTIRDDVLSAAENLADAIESGHHGPPPAPLTAEGIGLECPTSRLEALAQAFAMERPPVDARGEFEPALVLEHYVYDTTRLYDVVIPHLHSLGLPPVHDALAMVRTPGLILSAEDPVLAHLAFFNWIQVRQSAEVRDMGSASEVLARIGEHLQRQEAALHQNREWTARQLTLNRDADPQTKAQTIADIYRRVVEGHLRTYLWALYCIDRGNWSEPPMLSELRDRMISHGGWYAAIATNTLLIDVRNGEVHAQLSWDGIGENYTVGTTPVPFDAVRDALGIADCFTRGCEAASLYLNALAADPYDSVPADGQAGRLPGWQRAKAFFGTNGLRLVDTNLNSSRAQVVVARLPIERINPCFQALLVARQVLPGVQTFGVSTADDPHRPLIEVSAEALDRTRPAWEMALRTLSVMPLVTFLPANHDARSRHETPETAAASVAYIAIDDLIDAVVRGSADGWTDHAVRTLHARLDVNVEAVARCLEAVDPRNAHRLTEVADIGAHLKASLRATADEQAAARGGLIDRSPSLRRAQLLWDNWPEPPRMPGIDTEDRTFGDSKVEAFERDPRWRTL